MRGIVSKTYLDLLTLMKLLCCRITRPKIVGEFITSIFHGTPRYTKFRDDTKIALPKSNVLVITIFTQKIQFNRLLQQRTLMCNIPISYLHIMTWRANNLKGEPTRTPTPQPAARSSQRTVVPSCILGSVCKPNLDKWSGSSVTRAYSGHAYLSTRLRHDFLSIDQRLSWLPLSVVADGLIHTRKPVCVVCVYWRMYCRFKTKL